MTAIARFEVIPVHEGSLSAEVAKAVDALDAFNVAYETTAMDTVIEAESTEELFEAVKAAHDALDGERIVTPLEIDEQPGRDQHLTDRVRSVERALGREPRG